MSEISDLFARDPLSLTREDIDALIKRYREARAQFNLGVKNAGATKKVKEVGPKITEINLDELGL